MWRRCGAPATPRSRWGTWGKPGTSPTRRCFLPPTNRNTSPASNSWSTAASPAGRALKVCGCDDPFQDGDIAVGNQMRVGPRILIPGIVVAGLLCGLPRIAGATGTEPAQEPLVDPAPCVAAVAANDDDKIVAVCGALIDNEKTAKGDRIKALIARAGVYRSRDQVDRAIGDYDTVLWLDPALADIHNSRGELWRKTGDRRKALTDFAAALKLKPDFAAARANHKDLSLEIERIGALMAVYNKPSFNCATARRAVEKAICANPELANLDREINAVHTKVV